MGAAPWAGGARGPVQGSGAGARLKRSGEWASSLLVGVGSGSQALVVDFMWVSERSSGEGVLWPALEDPCGAGPILHWDELAEGPRRRRV